VVEHLAPEFQAHLAAKVHVQNGAQIEGHDNPLDQGDFLAAQRRSAIDCMRWQRNPAFYPWRGRAAWVVANSAPWLCDATLPFAPLLQ
jgi:hypothetical protein